MITGFYMADDERIAGEAQYVVTEDEIKREYKAYLGIFSLDADEHSYEDFQGLWRYIDTDDIEDDRNYLRHNLQNELDSNNPFHGDERIVEFVKTELAKYEG